MQTLASFFEWINKTLGVEKGTDLLFHPAFIGLVLILFVYCLIKGWKIFGAVIYLVMATAVIHHYLWPSNTSDLLALVKFLVAIGGAAMVGIYFGFIRE